MDEKSLSDQLSQLFPPQNSDAPAPEGEMDPAQRGFLIDSLQSIAGQAGGGLPDVINQFLGGQGELAATAQTAGMDSIIQLLTTKFKISPVIASLIAPILIKLASSLFSQATGNEPTEKPKPRRKTSSTTKKETTSSAKKKPAANSAKSESSTSKKRKTGKTVVDVN